jgi:hypothetical protein
MLVRATVIFMGRVIAEATIADTGGSLNLLAVGRRATRLGCAVFFRYSTRSSTQPGRVAGLFFKNTTRRVFGKGNPDLIARS